MLTLIFVFVISRTILKQRNEWEIMQRKRRMLISWAISQSVDIKFDLIKDTTFVYLGFFFFFFLLSVLAAFFLFPVLSFVLSSTFQIFINIIVHIYTYCPFIVISFYCHTLFIFFLPCYIHLGYFKYGNSRRSTGILIISVPFGVEGINFKYLFFIN